MTRAPLTVRRKVTLAVAALVAGAELAAWADRPEPRPIIQGEIRSRLHCEARGGKFHDFGMPDHPYRLECNLPTHDGGKACLSSAECEGFCVERGASLTGQEAKGLCSPRRYTEGCLMRVENGRAHHDCSRD